MAKLIANLFGMLAFGIGLRFFFEWVFSFEAITKMTFWEWMFASWCVVSIISILGYWLAPKKKKHHNPIELD